MKTRKYNLSAIAMGVALAMGSISAAQAVPVNPSKDGLDAAAAAERNADLSVLPTFNKQEKSGIALVESALSLIAARTHVDEEFCPESRYTLTAVATNGVGTALIDGGPRNGGTKLTSTITGDYLGYQVLVSADAGSLLAGLAIGDYSGNHHWSHDGSIFVDKAKFTIEEPQSFNPIQYSENSIKDFYKQVLEVDGVNQAWEFDWGLEVVNKDSQPVTKWTEASWFHRADGSQGKAKVVKELLAPGTGAVQCRITYNATGTTQFNFSGNVTVKNFTN